MANAMKSIKGPSPRTLPGPGTESAEINYNGPAGHIGGGQRARGWQDDDSNMNDAFLLPAANAGVVGSLLVQGLQNQALRFAQQQSFLEALNRQQANLDEATQQAKEQNRRLRSSN